MVDYAGENIRFDERQPIIYLDHCAVRAFIENEAYFKALMDILRYRGTLAYSLAHALELIKNPPFRFDGIKRFYEGIGKNWIPIDIQGPRVIARENGPPGIYPPWFDLDWAQKTTEGAGNHNLSLLAAIQMMERVKGEPEVIAKQIEFKTEISQMFKDAREEWQRRPGDRDQIFSVDGLPSHLRARFVNNRCMRILCNDSFRIVPNDSMDFMHFVVPLAHCDAVVVDSKWEDIARKMKLPEGYARVYRVTAISSLLEDLKWWRWWRGYLL